MTNENFMRRYSMKCGRAGQQGFQIGNVDNVKDTALHVSFSIEKSTSESPNEAKVQIWNLSNENLNILETKDCIVELRAGYEDNTALVLVGNIASVVTTLDNADRMTELEVVDGMVALRDAIVSVSLNGKVNTKDVYTRIAKEMGLSVVFASDLSFKAFPNGFTFVGSAKNALQKVANYCGHNWTIQNEVLQITLAGRPVSTRGYLLSSETGLIGVPKRVMIGTESKKSDSKEKTESGETKKKESTPKEEPKKGWEVEYLLNGAIGINDVVELKSSTANGYFLVHKVTIEGDNLEGNWLCTAQLLEINANASLDNKKEENEGTEGNIKKGDKVKVIRTIKEGGKTKGYQYAGGTFVCWYDVYDVIQVKGERVVIGIGTTVTAAVNAKDLEKV